MNIDAIIFDMDGLLVDSERVWHVAESAMMVARGVEYGDDVREAIVGKRMDEFLTYLRDYYGFEETVAVLSDELHRRVLKLIETEVKAQPGAQAVIDFVRDNGIPHAIASSSSMRVINATLASQGWNTLFEIRCTAEDEPLGKPAPDVYLTAARKLGFAPERCLALEDSPNGARAAVAAGMTCLAVPDLSHTRREAFAGITPHVFDDLHAVVAYLNQP